MWFTNLTLACCQPRRQRPREHRPWCGASMAWRLLSLVLKASSQREAAGEGGLWMVLRPPWTALAPATHRGHLWPEWTVYEAGGEPPGERPHLQEGWGLVVDTQCPTLRSFTWGNIRFLGGTEPQCPRQSPLISLPSWPLLLLVSPPSSLRLCWHHLHTDYVSTPNLCPDPASGTQTKMPVFPTMAA